MNGTDTTLIDQVAADLAVKEAAAWAPFDDIPVNITPEDIAELRATVDASIARNFPAGSSAEDIAELRATIENIIAPILPSDGDS